MFGLIGHPLGHSMSPFIHEKLFALSGKNESYKLCDIEPETFKTKLTEVINSYDGINVTIPYKIKVIDFLDRLDDSAKKYNSVNCISKENGKLIGYNTDCVGFLRSVPEAALSGKFLLAGCGGVGRMMALESASKGGKITIAIRESDGEMAKTLVSEINEKYPGTFTEIVLLNEIQGNYDLLANSTPVGMYPNINACPVSEEVISKCENVFDAIYNPNETMLLKSAKKFGKKAIGGMYMLVLQAQAAHEIWYGAKFDKKDTDEIVSSASETVEKLFK